MQKLEKILPGEVLYIYNNGNNFEDLFYEQKNYNYFLEKYLKYICPISNTYAYSMLKNQFHFLIRINSEAEIQELSLNGNNRLSIPFSNMFNSYSKSINKMYSRTGSLFQERFKRKLIESEEQLKSEIRNIHRIPQESGCTEDFRKYPYSSYQLLLEEGNSVITLYNTLELFGGRDEFINYHNSDELGFSMQKKSNLKKEKMDLY